MSENEDIWAGMVEECQKNRAPEPVDDKKLREAREMYEQLKQMQQINPPIYIQGGIHRQWPLATSGTTALPLTYVSGGPVQTTGNIANYGGTVQNP